MQQVNVFIETSSRFRGNAERKCGYVLSTQLRTGEGTKEHLGRVTGTYHQAILLTMVDALDHMADMDDASVPQEGRILYLTSAVQKLLKEADGITRTMSVGAAGVIDRRVHGLDDVMIKTVPSARFKDKYDFTTGCVPAIGAKQINMILVHPSCVISRDKYAYMKLFTPGSDSRTADKYVYQNRYYTDTFLIENKSCGIAVNKVGE